MGCPSKDTRATLGDVRHNQREKELNSLLVVQGNSPVNGAGPNELVVQNAIMVC